MSVERHERLRGIALHYLGRRERTSAEVRERLVREDAGPEQVDAVIADLADDGLLNDERYARLFVQDRRSLDGWGRERIERALRDRGIEREIVAAAIAGEDDGATELDRALALLRRRFPRPPANRRESERALGVMVRKGFETDVALDALLAYGHA